MGNSKDNSKNKVSTIDRKKLITIICAAAAVLFVAIIVITVLDTMAKGKMYLTNDTDKNIESRIVYFADDDGNLVDNIFEGSLKAGEKMNFDYGSEIKYTGTGEFSNECVIIVKFEGEEELAISDGSFWSDFNGIIRLRFFMKDGEYYLHTKAGIGVFENTKKTDMDTDIIIDFENNDWDYIL